MTAALFALESDGRFETLRFRCDPEVWIKVKIWCKCYLTKRSKLVKYPSYRTDVMVREQKATHTHKNRSTGLRHDVLLSKEISILQRFLRIMIQ